MPLAAYFRNVGAALFALFFLADFYSPAAPVVQKPAVYPPVIRIYSDHKWPERVVYDTAQPTIVVAESDAAPIELAALPDMIEVPAARLEVPTVQDAFALMPRSEPRRPDFAHQRKRTHKPHYRMARSNRYVNQRMAFAARNRQFAWFGFQQWR